MGENTAQKNRVYNPERKNCPLSNRFNNLYKKDTFQKKQVISESDKIGRGYCQRHIVNAEMEIFVTDMTFYENLTIAEEICLHPHYGLAFCLGNPLLWKGEGHKREHEIGCGESYIFNGILGNSSCKFYAGQRFFGINLQYGPDTIANLLAHMGVKYKNTMPGYNKENFYVKKFSPTINLILQDIVHCRYDGDIKKIYLEGKAMELLAVYMNEVVLESGRPVSLSNFSTADVKAIHHARSYLDDNIANPPTIGQLAKIVYLNDYKLKAGFKELFGRPIHAYIIEKRMERARFLMTERNLGVTEAALLVGYSNASHFTKKFKEEYGINPSKYIKGRI